MDVAVAAMILIVLATAGVQVVSRTRANDSSRAAVNSSPESSIAGPTSPSPSSQSPSPHHSPTPSPVASKVPATPKPVQNPPAQQSSVPHIMVIVEENNSYSAIIGNSQLPYINSLAQKYVLATNWWGVSHPSEPNYLAMVSGSIWDNPQDLTPQNETYPGPTVADQLAAKGIAWKAYMEDMPASCDLTDQYSPGDYDVNHNPFMYFNSIRNNPSQCNRDVPFTQFSSDLANGTAPPFMYVVPNLNDDMHNGTYATADSWLQTQLALVFASRWYAQGGTVVLTWDEGESGGDQIATIVIAARLAGHGAFTPYGNHYGLLRGLEKLYGLDFLSSAGDSKNGDLSQVL
jgi:phosphatidylinositol-3-phosphatase